MIENPAQLSTNKLVSPALWRRVLVAGVSLLPAYFILLIINRYAYNMPYYDEWLTLVYFFNHPGTPIGQFWALYNEHRAFIPKVAQVILAQITNMNMIVQMIVDVGLVVAALGLLYLIYRKAATASVRYLILLPFSILLFSLIQYPMWVISVAFPTYIVECAFLASLATIVCIRPGWVALFVSAFFAYIGAMSLFPGNLIWLVIFAAMIGLGYRKKRFYIAWIIMAASILIPYAVDYLATLHDPIALNLADFVHFILAMIGSPVSFGETSAAGISVAVPMGIVGVLSVLALGIGISLFVENGLKKVTPWLAISAWVIGIAVFGALGRVVRFGALSGRQYRFMPYGVLFWVSVVALIAIALTEPRRTDRRIAPQFVVLRAVPVVIGILIGIGYLNGTLNATESFDFYNNTFGKGHDCLLTYETASDECLSSINPVPAIIRQEMPGLLARNVAFLPGSQFYLERAYIETPSKAYTQYQSRVIDGVPRRVLFMQPNSTATWLLQLPAAKHIVIQTGVMVDIPQKYEADPSDGALFLVEVNTTDGKSQKLLEKLVMPRKIGQGFEPVSVDVSAYAGKTITLSFGTRAGLDAKATYNYDWALWQPPSLDVET